jgi:hypothetical protein
MSVKVLKLISQKSDNYIIIKDEEAENEFILFACSSEKGLQVTLDRNQAHLLMMYLQEHLDYRSHDGRRI